MPVLAILFLAAVVAMLLAGITVYRRNERRTPHLQALVDGQITVESLPDSLQRRLADPRHRAALAGTLRKTAKDAAKVPKRRTLPNPPVTYFFRKGVRDEIVAVADLIELPETPTTAIALTELLLADGTSAFYGQNEAALVRVLDRISRAAQSTHA